MTSAQKNSTIATSYDAKGDLLAGTGADAFAKLTVGANGLSLVADSTASTGLKWGTPNYIGCSVYKSGNQSINNATYTAVTFDTELFDTDGIHSNTTNTSRFTVPTGKAGKWRLEFIVWYASASGVRSHDIRKNGTSIQLATQIDASTTLATGIPFSMVFDLAANDYIEIFGYQNSGGTGSITGTLTYTSAQFTYLGA